MHNSCSPVEQVGRKVCSRLLLCLCVLSSGIIQAQRLAPVQGQPANKPTLFAEGLVSTHLNELNATFSPDGNHFLYTVANASSATTFYTIFVMERKGGQWSKPTVAPFSGQYSDADPAFSPDGKEVYFVSYRPSKPGQAPQDNFDIWVVPFNANAWGIPSHLDGGINTAKDELYPSVTRSGTLYFSTDVGTDKYDIQRARRVNGAFAQSESVGSAINTPAVEYDAYVAPDESFMVFTAIGRPDGLGSGDLYISHCRDGVWGKANNLGPAVNTSAMDQCPYVSQDGKIFFFTSFREAAAFTNQRKKTTADYLRLLNTPLNGLGNVFWMQADVLNR